MEIQIKEESIRGSGVGVGKTGNEAVTLDEDAVREGEERQASRQARRGRVSVTTRVQCDTSTAYFGLTCDQQRGNHAGDHDGD